MRAGDTIKPKARDEHWTCAYADERSGYLSWLGWPPGEIRISDCELVEACSDEEHRATLEMCAESTGDGFDRRQSVCQRQLWALRIKLGELQPPDELRLRYLHAARTALREDFAPAEGETAAGWSEEEQRVADAIQEARESNANG